MRLNFTAAVLKGELFLESCDAIPIRQLSVVRLNMTVDGYYAEIREMGLRPSNVETIYIDRNNMTQRVPLPHGMTPEQRAETIDRIRLMQGLRPKFSLN